MDYPKGWQGAENAHFKDFDPYDEYRDCEDEGQCCSCLGLFNEDDLKETSLGVMCETCIDDGYADTVCDKCDGSGEGYIEFGRCLMCNGKGVKKT